MALTINSAQYNSGADYETVTGEIVSIADAKPYVRMKRVVADINPVQDLHGYDHPWPAGGGKNKLPITASTQEVSGITYTVLKDSDNNVIGVRANGTATANSYFYFIGGGATALTLPNGNYKLNGCTGGSASTYSLIARIKPSIWVTNANGDTDIAVSDADLDNIAIRIMSGTTVNNVVFYPMIRLATESDATFVPYSNKCPISGWSEAKVTRTGKNFLSVPSIELGGTNPRTVNINVDPIPTGQYYFSSVKGGTVTSNYGIQFIGNNGLVAQVSTNAQSINITEPIIRIYAYMSSADYSDGKTLSLSDIQLERGSSASSYEPYNGQTYTISLGDTRYGAVLDVTRGKLRVTKVDVDMGEQNWTLNATGVFQIAKSAFDLPMKTGTSAFLICSTYPTGTSTSQFVCIFQTTNAVRVADSAYASYTADQFKTAMSGQTICYELATPIEVDLTPTEITTLLGTNNLWSDTGDIEVEYCADTKKYIQKLISALS